jgi:DNA-binding HxlR family transcriptional regulator
MEMEMNINMNIVLCEQLSDESSDQFRGRTTRETINDEKSASFFAWNLLGKRWTFLLVAELLAGPQSFQELFKHIQGISESVLSERLKELEREGVVQRQVHERRPLRVTYRLTAKGEALEPVIRAIGIWSQF